MAARPIDFLHPYAAECKATNFPQCRKSSDASGARPYLVFPDSVDAAAYWTGYVPEGFTAPLVAVVKYAADVTSGNVVFELTVEAITPGDSMDTDSSESLDSANVATADTVPATAGNTKDVTITCTNNDGAAAGDMIRYRLRRLASTSGSDTVSGNVLVYGVAIKDDAG